MNPLNAGKRRKLRGRMVAAAIAGAAAMVVASTLGGGVAGALTAPAVGPPSFNQTQASELIRGSGSDTTFFVMQKIGDLYTSAGLYGCNLGLTNGQALFNTGTVVATNTQAQDCQPPTADSTTTDDVDNWNRVEVVQGVNDVGSGAGQNQLCSNGVPLPVGLNVDFARSSKPSANISGCNEKELGYAKDGVPVVTFPTVNPSTFGTSTFGATPGDVASSAYPNGGYNTINGGLVGPVAAGWLPGDNPAGTANHGTKLVNVSNVSVGGVADTSVASRLWCDNHLTNTSGATATITDWGQLTNLGPNLELNVNTTAGQPGVTVAASSGGAVPNTIGAGQTVTDPFATVGVTPFAATTVLSTGPGNLITMNSNATHTGTYTLTFATGVANTTFAGTAGTLASLGGSLTVGSVAGFPTTVGTGTLVVAGVSPTTQPFQYTGVSGSTLTGVTFPNLSSTQLSTATVASGATVAKAQFAEGYGASVGVPIRIMGVNLASGTVFTFGAYADGTSPSDAGGLCDNKNDLTNINAANDPKASTIPATGPYSTNPSGITGRFALENNAHQLELFSQADFPGDFASQAVEEATTLYYMSNGVYNTNSYVGQTTINGTSFSAFQVAENGVPTGAPVELSNAYPTARTLSNIVNSATVRQSTAGFMNYICDSNSVFTKGTDLNTGLNYDAELGNIISTQFGFPRLSDLTPPVSPASPTDNTIAPNDDCAAQIPVTISGGVITQTGGGSFPVDLINGGSVIGTGVPASDTLTSAGGGANIASPPPRLTVATPWSSSEFRRR